MSRHSTEYSFNQNEEMGIIQNPVLINQSRQIFQQSAIREQVRFLQQLLPSNERSSSEIPIIHRNMDRQGENSHDNSMRMNTERELEELERRHQSFHVQAERNSSNLDIIQNQQTQAINHSIQSGNNQSEREQYYKNKLIQREAFYKKKLAQAEALYQRKLIQTSEQMFEKSEKILLERFKTEEIEKTMQFQRRMAQNKENHLNRKIADLKVYIEQKISEMSKVISILTEREAFFKQKYEFYKEETQRLMEFANIQQEQIKKLKKLIIQTSSSRNL